MVSKQLRKQNFIYLRYIFYLPSPFCHEGFVFLRVYLCPCILGILQEKQSANVIYHQDCKLERNIADVSSAS